jgi:hypothetical protein
MFIFRAHFHIQSTLYVCPRHHHCQQLTAAAGSRATGKPCISMPVGAQILRDAQPRESPRDSDSQNVISWRMQRTRRSGDASA